MGDRGILVVAQPCRTQGGGEGCKEEEEPYQGPKADIFGASGGGV